MAKNWFRMMHIEPVYVACADDSFSRLLRQFGGKNLTICFEVDGRIFLLDPKEARRLDAGNHKSPGAVTVGQAIKLFDLKPTKVIFKPGVNPESILDNFPLSDRTAIFQSRSGLQVWRRIGGGDRGGGSARPPSKPTFDDSGSGRGGYGDGSSFGSTDNNDRVFDFGSIEIYEDSGSSTLPEPSAAEPPLQWPAPDPLPTAPVPTDVSDADNAVEPKEQLLGESMIGDHPDIALPVEPDGGRWINAVLKNHDVREPLKVELTYNLAISIDTDPEASSGKLSSMAADPSLRSGTTEYQLEVEIIVDEEACELNISKQKLRISKDGLSIGEAIFQLTPKKDGPQTISAVIHRDNNLIQKLDISFDVGFNTATGVQVVPLRKKLTFPAKGIRRDVTLIIEPKDGRYTVQAVGDAVNKFEIRITTDDLETYVNNARNALLQIVKMVDNSPSKPEEKFPFQSSVDIPPAIEAESLKIVAEAGQKLFSKVFFHHQASSQCKDFGDWLISEANSGKNIILQINAELFPVPWAMLYPARAFTPDNLSWERFLGMRYVIEQTPLRNDGFSCDPVIQEGDAGIAVSLNLNMDIEGTHGYISRQTNYWRSIEKLSPKIKLVERISGADVLRALANPGNDEQIIYLYCHAESVGLGVGSGTGDSSFTFTNRENITLDNLDQSAPASTQFTKSPLVFINACESGAMSPVSYSGFISYFIGKGARGVIGTECKVPALFAEIWAKEFFTRFLAGEEIGTVLLKMRQQYINEHRNGLGLLYGLHCNADTQVESLAA